MRGYHRGLRYSVFGDPTKVLQMASLPNQAPGPNELRVKMLARTINPSDLLSIRGEGPYKHSVKLPRVPGFEGVGVIVEKGQGVKSFAIGERVYALRGGVGTWQEFININENEVVTVPTNMSNDFAAQLYINPLTAWLMIKKLNLNKNDVVIINAANSTMGKLFT